jgi:hypothetical protein
VDRSRHRSRPRLHVQVHVDPPAARHHGRRAAAPLPARTAARAGSVRRVHRRDARVPAGAPVERGARLGLVPLPARARAGCTDGLADQARARSRRWTARARVADPLRAHGRRGVAHPAPPARRRAVRARGGGGRELALLRL